MIRIHKKRSVPVCIALSVAMLLSGCSQKETGQPLKSTVNTETQTADNTNEELTDSTTTKPVTDTEAEATPAESTATETHAITISVLNLSNVQIGMFSVIDPVTKEQINLDNLEPGQSVSMDCNWPSDVSQFQWALYNQNGELCMDASTDISQAEKSVALVLSGEDNIEDVKTLFDKESSDSE